MGRRSWSNRRTVEDCRTIDIRSLVTLFAVPLSARTIYWTSGFVIHYRQNPGVDPSKPLCWPWGMVPKGAPQHREEACGTVTISDWDSRINQAEEVRQSVEIVAIPRALKQGLRFGVSKRYYFRCPGLGSAPCRNRVSKLYMPRGESDFACRACHNLTYESVKEHDWRVDYLRRLPLEQLGQLLQCRDFKMSLLALKALGRWMK